MKQLEFVNKSFEKVVRHELLIYDRPITDEDALLAYDLDCSDFIFDIEDCETLCAFKNLDWLDITIGFENMSFLQNLKNLEELTIEFYGDDFDFTYLSLLKKLTSIMVTGGAWSNFNFHNLNAISQLPLLKELTLHEFGSVDLLALKEMPQLKGFYCGYASKVENVSVISNLINLESLILIDFAVDNLEFLDSLSEDLILTLCSIEVVGQVSIEKLKRFKEYDLDEIVANGKRII